MVFDLNVISDVNYDIDNLTEISSIKVFLVDCLVND